ncbi:hypothetical protein [Enterococcus termitis]|uniref:Uncharacterized protein n=1 Tax=Enterococcus termitis TaxID=332950 RepID=A0A1E5G987_9ENTE|nr:hypothetical protein [Enterococcus termitis]OEG09257.1 hypothetical protein BCR25_11880 [Enterococcus termitis]OJG94716.1 hypothetical protein RV18_GL003180 [Enterococcus termitis]
MDLFKVTPNQLFYSLNIDERVITDRESKFRELESYRENILATVQSIEENASFIEYNEPIYDENGSIIDYREVEISSNDQARGVLVKAIDIENLDMRLLIDFFK